MTSLNQTKKHIPLIERCLVIGTLQRDLNNMNITYNNIINGNIKTLPIKILENFKSNYCNEEDDEKIKNEKGIISENNNKNTNQIITTMNTNSNFDQNSETKSPRVKKDDSDCKCCSIF